MHTFSAVADALCLLAALLLQTSIISVLYLVSPFSYFFPSLVGDFTVKHRAAMLSSVPKCEKTRMCFVEKRHVVDKLCLRHE